MQTATRLVVDIVRLDRAHGVHVDWARPCRGIVRQGRPTEAIVSQRSRLERPPHRPERRSNDSCLPPVKLENIPGSLGQAHK